MTPNQLRSALAQLGLSHRGAARLIDIDERTMRKYIAGDLVIPEMLVWALRGLAQRDRDQDALFGGLIWSRSMMNLRRGLFRLWIIGAALFVIAVPSISYPGIKAEFDAVESKPEAGTSTVLAEFRQQYPQYNDLSDDQLADAIYKKFYSDMPREQLDDRRAKDEDDQISGSTVPVSGRRY